MVYTKKMRGLQSKIEEWIKINAFVKGKPKLFYANDIAQDLNEDQFKVVNILEKLEKKGTVYRPLRDVIKRIKEGKL